MGAAARAAIRIVETARRVERRKPVKREKAPVANGGRLGIVEKRHAVAQKKHRVDRRIEPAPLERFERKAVGHIERTHLQAPERFDVGGRLEGAAHVARDRAYIGALRHRKTHVPIQDVGVVVALDIARLELDDIARTRRLVGLHAVALDRGIGGRKLFMPPDERGDIAAREFGIAYACGDLADMHGGSRRIVGVSRHAEGYPHVVGLVVVRHICVEACGRTDADAQRARRQRVERAGMADAAFAENTAAGVDHVVRAQAARLVDAHDA